MQSAIEHTTVLLSIRPNNWWRRRRICVFSFEIESEMRIRLFSCMIFTHTKEKKNWFSFNGRRFDAHIGCDDVNIILTKKKAK